MSNTPRIILYGINEAPRLERRRKYSRTSESVSSVHDAYVSSHRRGVLVLLPDSLSQLMEVAKREFEWSDEEQEQEEKREEEKKQAMSSTTNTTSAVPTHLSHPSSLASRARIDSGGIILRAFLQEGVCKESSLTTLSKRRSGAVSHWGGEIRDQTFDLIRDNDVIEVVRMRVTNQHSNDVNSVDECDTTVASGEKRKRADPQAASISPSPSKPTNAFNESSPMPALETAAGEVRHQPNATNQTSTTPPTSVISGPPASVHSFPTPTMEQRQSETERLERNKIALEQQLQQQQLQQQQAMHQHAVHQAMHQIHLQQHHMQHAFQQQQQPVAIIPSHPQPHVLLNPQIAFGMHEIPVRYDNSNAIFMPEAFMVRSQPAPQHPLQQHQQQQPFPIANTQSVSDSANSHHNPSTDSHSARPPSRTEPKSRTDRVSPSAPNPVTRPTTTTAAVPQNARSNAALATQPDKQASNPSTEPTVSNNTLPVRSSLASASTTSNPVGVAPTAAPVSAADAEVRPVANEATTTQQAAESSTTTTNTLSNSTAAVSPESASASSSNSSVDPTVEVHVLRFVPDNSTPNALNAEGRVILRMLARKTFEKRFNAYYNLKRIEPSTHAFFRLTAEKEKELGSDVTANEALLKKHPEWFTQIVLPSEKPQTFGWTNQVHFVRPKPIG